MTDSNPSLGWSAAGQEQHEQQRRDQPEAHPGFLESLGRLLGSSSDYISARLQLLGLESKGALGNLVRVIILVAAALLLLLFTYVFLIIAFVFILQRLTQWNWAYITLGAGVLHLLLAGVCLWLAKGRLVGISFAGTIAEFKKDKEWLTNQRVTTSADGN
ncbi:MAG: phage holin family protein [Verrucomicrobia bacterium]|nr:phage holin family protein [Verrucomicrobiota bacterium]MBV9656492.1 phage holin family protein [Verrucomicrobiota bacterium]